MNKNIIYRNVISILLILFVFIIYYLTSAGTTPYNYFVKLAVAFTNSQYYLSESPPWLNELIPLGDNKFAVVYPPGPSILIMPLVYLFGPEIPQQLVAHFLGALLSLVVAKIAWIKTKSKKVFIWFFILTAFGNITWYLSSNGSVWYLGQVAGAFFLTASIYVSLSKKNILLASFFLAMAFVSRMQTILALPLIMYLNLHDKPSFTKLFKLGLPLVLAVSIYGFYNYIRFGSPLETGYDLIPGVLEEPWYLNGIFHFSYIENNLRVMFASFPIFKNTFPYITPSWGGLSIWITTPAFIYVLFANLKENANKFALVSLILIALVSFTHGGTGFTQFGYRYAVDFYPLLFYLLIDGIKNKGLKWHHWVLLIIGVIVNLWGVIWINKFDWVSF